MKRIIISKGSKGSKRYGLMITEDEWVIATYENFANEEICKEFAGGWRVESIDDYDGTIPKQLFGRMLKEEF